MSEFYNYRELEPVIRETLERGATVTLLPRGTSMLPLIRQGKDSVMLEKLCQKAAVGDVIFYQRPDGQFVLHRIVGEDKNGYILCGDNQYVKEYGVLADWIIGIMTKLFRDGQEIDLTDTRYIRYVKRLRYRRTSLKFKNGIAKVRKKIFMK